MSNTDKQEIQKHIYRSQIHFHIIQVQQMTTYLGLKQAFVKLHRHYYALADANIQEKTNVLERAKRIVSRMDDRYAHDLKFVQIPHALENGTIKVDPSKYLHFGFKWFSSDQQLSLIYTNMGLGNRALSYCRFQSLDELINYYTSPALKKFGVAIQVSPASCHTLPSPQSFTFLTIKNKLEDTYDSNLECEHIFQYMTSKEVKLPQDVFLKLYYQRKCFKTD